MVGSLPHRGPPRQGCFDSMQDILFLGEPVTSHHGISSMQFFLGTFRVSDLNPRVSLPKSFSIKDD